MNRHRRRATELLATLMIALLAGCAARSVALHGDPQTLPGDAVVWRQGQQFVVLEQGGLHLEVTGRRVGRELHLSLIIRNDSQETFLADPRTLKLFGVCQDGSRYGLMLLSPDEVIARAERQRNTALVLGLVAVAAGSIPTTTTVPVTGHDYRGTPMVGYARVTTPNPAGPALAVSTTLAVAEMDDRILELQSTLFDRTTVQPGGFAGGQVVTNSYETGEYVLVVPLDGTVFEVHLREEGRQ